MLVSIIILSYALDDEIYKMNCQCIKSLLDSEQWDDRQLEIFLIESNKRNPYSYDEKVKVLVPDETFNFHRYFNIGLSQTQGEFIAFCNNDIVFKEGWFSAIMEVKQKHPKLMCFSPLDRSYPLMGEGVLSNSKDYYIGWKNKQHFAAWCFVWERKVFDIIGPFDERFCFYYADDDELQTLRYHSIPNVLVTHSEVKHLSQIVTNKESKNNPHRITDKIQYPLTKEEIKRGFSWLWDDDRFYKGYQTMKAKWGSDRMRHRIDRFLERNSFLNISFITRILYNKEVNRLLCFLTGIKQ